MNGFQSFSLQIESQQTVIDGYSRQLIMDKMSNVYAVITDYGFDQMLTFNQMEYRNGTRDIV